MTLAKQLFQALKERGAQEVFGIPGDFALPFFKVLEDTAILPLYTLSHEPAVGFAADAAARYHSTLGVAAVTYGAGALNMVNPVAQAYVEKSPLVVLSGAPGALERTRGLGLHHQVKSFSSQLNIFREITATQTILDDMATAPAEIARVLDLCQQQSRPVYIELPRDMVNQACASVPAYRASTVDSQAASACARQVMAQLRAATSPAILAGVEVRRFGLEQKLAELASCLRIPVATSFMGRGILSGKEAPLIGTYLGLAGQEDVRKTVENSDALLMLGVILTDTNFGVSKREIDLRNAIHALDCEVRFAYQLYPDISLQALIDALLEIAQPVGTATARPMDDYPHHLVADEQPVTPTDIARAVNDLFVSHGRMPIAADMGDCLFTAMDIKNTELVAPGYYASMGPGIPAGIGLQVASGRRPLILVGDGAFQMTGWELGNCRRYGLNPIVLLFNNRSWEMLRTFQPGQQYHDLDDWQFAATATALGGHGIRVQTCRQLQNALNTAIVETGCFQLIEVMLERGEISRTLHRFVEAIKRLSAPESI